IIAPILWGLYAGGWILVYVASFLIDPNELFGIKQAFGSSPIETPFKQPWLYRFVRHPIMLGFLIAQWSAPVMSEGRMLLSTAFTIYIIFALQFEERDLRARHGREHVEYARRVPMLIPFTSRRSA